MTSEVAYIHYRTAATTSKSLLAIQVDNTTEAVGIATIGDTSRSIFIVYAMWVHID